jgi:hypothetical protein
MKFRIFLVLMSTISLNLSAETTSMVCKWKLWFDNSYEQDTFIFNIDKKTVYWVNEEQEISLDSLTEGLIQFEGIPASRVRIDKTKFKTHIPIKFSLNRITGELKVDSQYAKANYDSKCEIREPLL